LGGVWPRRIALSSGLFALGIGIYLFTRLFRLADYPIYFFGDEASQVLFAERLIDSGFHDRLGIWLPVYVEAAAQRWTPLISMYFHAISLALFGKSIFVARLTSALVSLLAGISVSLILKRAFKATYWWVGILLVAVTPAYFLHSRTAFETSMTTAFFGGFLLFYMLYRCESPRYLFPAMALGAAAFYSYSNAQAVMAACGLLLLTSDLPYHLRLPRRTLLAALALAVVLALPFVLFRINQPEAIGAHLRMINSYWVQPIPLVEKLALFTQKWAFGVSPQYWFWSNEHDLARHRMAGMGQMPTAALPFFLLGLGIALWRFRSSPHRAVIIAGIAAPVGAALLDIGIPRVLAFIIPANILVGIGLDWLLGRLPGWLSGKLKLPQLAGTSNDESPAAGRVFTGLASWGVFLILGASSLLLLRTALVEGPLWFRDYGLYGMQYGARQIFAQAVPDILRQKPDTQVLITSTWANGTDNFLQFFLDDEQRSRVRMDGVEAYLFKKLPLSTDMLFIMTASEYGKAANSPKFQQVLEEGQILYPDGTPGFYLVRLEYAADIDAIFEAEKEARRQLVDAVVTVDGEPVQLRFSQIDMGAPELMFDNDHFTLMRGLEANPYILELSFQQPRLVSGLEVDFGLVDITLTVTLYPADGSPEVTHTLTRRAVTDPQVLMGWEDDPVEASRVRIEILNVLSGETANIHIRELKLLP
jgi:hypothetical protein